MFWRPATRCRAGRTSHLGLARQRPAPCSCHSYSSPWMFRHGLGFPVSAQSLAARTFHSSISKYVLKADTCRFTSSLHTFLHAVQQLQISSQNLTMSTRLGKLTPRRFGGPDAESFLNSIPVISHQKCQSKPILTTNICNHECRAEVTVRICNQGRLGTRVYRNGQQCLLAKICEAT